MIAIYTYMGCTKVTTDYWDIRLSVTTSFISYYIHHIEISIYRDTSILI